MLMLARAGQHSLFSLTCIFILYFTYARLTFARPSAARLGPIDNLKKVKVWVDSPARADFCRSPGPNAYILETRCVVTGRKRKADIWNFGMLASHFKINM